MRKIIWFLYALLYSRVTSSYPHRELMEAVYHHITSAQRILDLGCGTCTLLSLLGDIELYIGIDSNPFMLYASKQECSSNCALVYRDLNSDLPPSIIPSPDTLVCINVLYALNDPVQFLKRIASITPGNSSLIIVNPLQAHGQSSLAAYHIRKLREFSSSRLDFWIRLLTFCLSAIPILILNLLISVLGDTGQFHFFSKDELSHILDESGFTVNHMETVYCNKAILIRATRRRDESSC